MLLDKYTLAIFSIIFGAFFKIYDDMNDNKLFKYNKYLKKYKKYINEFLKLSMTGLLTIISFNDFIFCYIFTILNLLNSFIDIPAYSNPYEFSGLINICLLFIYLCLTNKIKLHNIFSLLFFLLYVYIYYLVEFILLNNIEFGINKLIFRFITLILFLIIYFKFNYLNLYNNLILFCISGYFTSCMFQIFLICNYKKNKKCKKNKKIKNVKNVKKIKK